MAAGAVSGVPDTGMPARADVGSGGGFTYENVDGMIRPTFRGIPIAKVDALLETEALVA